MNGIICICGSTRFKSEIEKANAHWTRDGYIVLAPGVFGHGGDDVDDEMKARLDSLHLRKIELADLILVVAPGGYVGESTRGEISHAAANKKPIRWWVP